MKFDLEAFRGSSLMEPLRIGDVFPGKGGAQTRLWVIVAIGGDGSDRGMAHALGLDTDGNIVSSTSYARRVFEERERIGHADLSELVLRVCRI